MPGEADGGWVNVEFSGQAIDEGFGSFYLQLGRVSIFTIGNDADTDGLSAVACAPGRSGSVLSCPSVGSLDEAIAATKAVTDDEVTIKVFGVSQACERGELFDVSCACSAVEDFDTVPIRGLLDERSEDSFFDGVKTVVA